MIAGALIVANSDVQTLEIAPPRYEEVSDGSPASNQLEFAHHTNEKATYRASQVSDTVHTQSSLPPFLHPVDEDGPGTSGSNTLLV